MVAVVVAVVAVVVESCKICRPRGSGRIVVIRVEDTAKMSYAIIYFYFFSFSIFNFKIGLIHQASPPLMQIKGQARLSGSVKTLYVSKRKKNYSNSSNGGDNNSNSSNGDNNNVKEQKGKEKVCHFA